ncbi:MAG: type VI secretion system baseplate subunit TssF [Alphaproteobacteria bacterium]
MSDRLLDFYNRELSFIRQMGESFARQHPGIAGHLRMSGTTVEDPHVSRLIEAFALLNARTRLKLEDDFPELTQSLLDLLYPHYLAPIPSMAIARLRADPAAEGVASVKRMTEVDTEPVAGETCRFRTCFDTDVWPVELTAVQFSGSPVVAPANRQAPNAEGALRITLRCMNEQATFSDLQPDRLRFFISAQPQIAYLLYELIFNHTQSVAFADGPADTEPVIVDKSVIEPVGFGPDQGMLPYPARSFAGYRLLTEFFAFPEKFLFFDIAGFDAKTLIGAGRTLELFLYFDRSATELERGVSADALTLGCTPIVNLFRQRADPVRLTHSQSEYRVVPDARRPRGTEVYSVDNVSGRTAEGDAVAFEPFFALRHSHEDSAGRRYWHARRSAAVGDIPGTQTHLAFVDLDFNPNIAHDLIVSIETTCLNRNLPDDLPFGGGHPELRFVEPNAAVAGIVCVTAPTSTLRLNFGEAGYVRLMSHLALNHLSLTGDEAAATLREILTLYDFRDAPETRAVIGGIVEVSTRPTAARAPGAIVGAICRGLEVSVTFDPSRFSGSGMFLMASVLERFFALYASANSFTQFVARVRGRKGPMKKWPPRAGQRQIL